MRIERIAAVLTALATAVSLASLMVWTAGGAQAEPVAPDLERISEETGFLAAETPLFPDCFFDDDYRVYLCEHPTPAERPQSNPAARAEAMSLLAGGGALFIINSTAKQLMVFDPLSGDLVDPVFIQLDDAATGVAIHAIISANNSILISDQTRNVVHEYNFDGDYLGVFAPAGGENTAIMQNIRGIALRPNGNLLVSVGAGANADAIVEFDTAGNHVGNFIDNGSGGLDSPYDVYERPNTDWLVSSMSNNQVLQYQWASGAPIGQFAAISSFPQQIYDISNGNVLVANFSGTPGVYEFEADGTPIGVYSAPGISGYRGVYELPNGNLLTATSGGVYEINRSGDLIETKHTGQSRFIELVHIPTLQLNKTVGLDASTCADTNEISVPPNTAVTYCFEITNDTAITLTRQHLVDGHLGVLLNDESITLLPGASMFLTQTAVITQTTVNTATWTAYNPGPVDVFEDTAAAVVTVVPPSISLSKRVGTDPSTCAGANEISVPLNTAVTYCYLVTNTSLTTFNLHDLEDSALGVILNGAPVTLPPGASAFVTQTAVITQTTVNAATWTAYNPGPTDVATAVASATVNILTPAVSLNVTVGTEPDSCATTNAITVMAGTAVVYCYTIHNIGDLPFSQHTVTDSVLGQIANFAYDLQPGAAVSLLHTHTILTDTVSTVTWLAETGSYSAAANDMVTVIAVDEFRLYLPVVLKP
jgi:hypothetical protein